MVRSTSGHQGPAQGRQNGNGGFQCLRRLAGTCRMRPRQPSPRRRRRSPSCRHAPSRGLDASPGIRSGTAGPTKLESKVPLTALSLRGDLVVERRPAPTAGSLDSTSEVREALQAVGTTRPVRLTDPEKLRASGCHLLLDERGGPQLRRASGVDRRPAERAPRQPRRRRGQARAYRRRRVGSPSCCTPEGASRRRVQQRRSRLPPSCWISRPETAKH